MCYIGTGMMCCVSRLSARVVMCYLRLKRSMDRVRMRGQVVYMLETRLNTSPNLTKRPVSMKVPFPRCCGPTLGTNPVELQEVPLQISAAELSITHRARGL